MTPLHTIKREFDAIIDVIKDDVSRASSLKMIASKTLILGCASYLETVITEIVVNELKIRGDDSCPVYNFAKIQGVHRKYHTWFDWKKQNANDFYSQFGDKFKAFSTVYVNDQKREFEKAFMKIGADRNILIHNNFISQNITDEYSEVFSRCELAIQYPDVVKSLFNEFRSSILSNGS